MGLAVLWHSKYFIVNLIFVQINFDPTAMTDLLKEVINVSNFIARGLKKDICVKIISLRRQVRFEID